MPFRWASRFLLTVQDIKNINKMHSGPGKQDTDVDRRQVRGSRGGAMQGFQSGNRTENFKSKKLLGQTLEAYPKENFCSIRVFRISHGSPWEGIRHGRDAARGPVHLPRSDLRICLMEETSTFT